MSAAIDSEDLEELAISMPAPRRGAASTTKTVEFSPAPAAEPTTAAQESRSKDAKASQRLGQYTIVKTLGEGSFGKVKLATHQVSGQKVALKIINRKRLVTRDMAGRIEREIQYLQLLRHPHIIKLCVTPFCFFFLRILAGHGMLKFYLDTPSSLPQLK